MKFRIRKKETLPDAIRRIVGEQLGVVVRAMSHEKVSATSIHRARKAIKKARAVLQLVVDCDGTPLLRDHDCRLRDAARMLSPARDVYVQKRALEKLSVRSRHLLEQQLRKQQAHTIARTGGVTKPFSATIHLAQERAAKLPVEDVTNDTIAIALQKSYRRARKCFKHACEASTSKKLHEWRKATKMLRDQLRVIDKITGRKFNQLRKTTNQISAYVGEDHDLFLLMQLLAGANHPQARTVKRELRDMRQKLQQRALNCGRKAFDHSPSEFSEQLTKSL